MPKKTRKAGWADTTAYPHKNHPAHYRRCSKDRDAIDYLTFTHSSRVDLGKKQVYTIPLSESISKAERTRNRAGADKKRSYVYPRVFHGKRSALGKESDKYEPTEEDAQTIDALFATLEHEDVPDYGGKGKLAAPHKKKKDPGNGVKTVPQSSDALLSRGQARHPKYGHRRSSPSKSIIPKKQSLSTPKFKTRSKKK